MSNTLFVERAPPMWWLEGAAANGSLDSGFEERDVLRLGSYAVNLDDVVSYRLEEVAERDVDGLALVAFGSLTVAVAILSGVINLGWLERFLIASAFLGILGIASLGELTGVNTIRYMRVTIFTKSGQQIPFTAKDEAEVGRLVTFLDRVLGRVR